MYQPFATPEPKVAYGLPLAADGNAEQGDVCSQHTAERAMLNRVISRADLAGGTPFSRADLSGGMPLAAPVRIDAAHTAAYNQALQNTQQHKLKQALEEKESALVETKRERDEALVETKRFRNDLDSALAKIGELETQVAGIQQRPPTQSRVGFVFGSAFQTRVYIGCHNPASSRWQLVIQHARLQKPVHILKFTVQP